MLRLLPSLVLVFMVTALMGTQCDKGDYIAPAKEGFAEGVDLWPTQKTYAVNDTLWLHFQTPSKTLYDTISRQRLSSSAVQFAFGAALIAKYDYPAVPSGVFCDFVLPANVTPHIFTSSMGTSASFEVGCDNTPYYDITMGVVPKYKGYYILDMASASPIQACSGQVNPYPSAFLRFTYTMTDLNKDVYLSIPASARVEYPEGITEKQLDAKVSYALRVE